MSAILDDMRLDAPDAAELDSLVRDLIIAWAEDVEEGDERALRFFSSPCHANVALEAILELYGVI